MAGLSDSAGELRKITPKVVGKTGRSQRSVAIVDSSVSGTVATMPLKINALIVESSGGRSLFRSPHPSLLHEPASAVSV